MSKRVGLYFNSNHATVSHHSLSISPHIASEPQSKGFRQTIIRAGTNAALHNSGVMRHGLNTIYYANQHRPIMAAREGAAAVWDAVTGSRK